jgi:hypothetical protein
MSVLLGRIRMRHTEHSKYGIISYRMCPRRHNERIVDIQKSNVDSISKNTQSHSPETPAVSVLASEETLVGLEL